MSNLDTRTGQLILERNLGDILFIVSGVTSIPVNELANDLHFMKAVIQADKIEDVIIYGNQPLRRK